VRRALLGAVLAATAERALQACPPGGAERWQRVNHRGAVVSLLSGPALAVAAAGSSDLPRAAAAVASIGAWAVGAYDDGRRSADRAKGFRGHAAALRQGRVTGGTVKVLGIGATGLLSARLAGRPDVLVSGAVVAASANLVNLLDLRPGRALKAAGLAAMVLRQPGPAAAAGVLLPGDLHERTMLGDGGANAVGAVLGVALLRRVEARRALAALVVATAASEVVSYSRVIDAVPPLRWADRVGRLP